MAIAVVIPLKSFADAKGRLSSSMSANDRQRLMQEMAATVVAAARPLPTFVVCDDADVASWALARRCNVLWRPANGLNDALTKAADSLTRFGYDRVLIAHGDLPQARNLGAVPEGPGVSIITDVRNDGTNVLCVPLGVGFNFAYGPGSQQRHAAEAQRLGLDVVVRTDPHLSIDIDLPEDLDLL